MKLLIINAAVILDSSVPNQVNGCFRPAGRWLVGKPRQAEPNALTQR